MRVQQQTSCPGENHFREVLGQSAGWSAGVIWCWALSASETWSPHIQYTRAVANKQLMQHLPYRQCYFSNLKPTHKIHDRSSYNMIRTEEISENQNIIYNLQQSRSCYAGDSQKLLGERGCQQQAQCHCDTKPWMQTWCAICYFYKKRNKLLCIYLTVKLHLCDLLSL